MRIVMTLLVRDEEDIVRENLLFHYAMGVDFVIATDNKSTDRTKEILLEFRDKGRLEYIYEPEDNYSQDKWVTRMARMAASKYQADWVINNDADEFWFPIGYSSLKESLGALPKETNTLEVPRYDMLLPDSDNSQRHFYEKMIYKDCFSVNASGIPLPPKVAHRAHKRIRVEMGNHAVKWPWLYHQHLQKGGVEILHFPIRSKEQFENKIRLGGQAYANNTKFPESIGSTWRMLFRDLQTQGHLNDFLDQRIWSEEALQNLVKIGRVVVDERLATFLKAIC